MKTYNDRPANQKGSPTQTNRSGSDQSKGSAASNKDGKHAAPAKLPATGDSPKSGIDVRAGGAASPAVAKPPGQVDAKSGSARTDADRKSS